MGLKILRTQLPNDKSVAWSIVLHLHTSWYEKGLSGPDLAGLIPHPVNQVQQVLTHLEKIGLVEMKTKAHKIDSRGYVLTDRCKELIADAGRDPL